MPDDVYTLLADVKYLANRWLPYLYDRKLAVSKLYTSGLIRVDPQLSGYATAPGKTFTVPRFNKLTGLDQLLTSNSRVAVSNIGTSTMTGTRNIRWTAWGYEDLAAAITSADPATAIADQAATWETNADMDAVGSILTGLFTTNGCLRASNYQSIAVETAPGPDNKLSGINAMQALIGTLGDAGLEGIDIVAMHSGAFLQILKADLSASTLNLPSGVSVNVTLWLGKYVIVVSDSIGARRLGTGNGTPFVFRTYFFGAGSFGYGQGLPPGIIPIEREREAKENKNDTIYRRGFVVHPYGTTYKGLTQAAEWPTNDEYATANNWAIADTYTKQDIHMFALDHN